ncbi:helix-turn-helix transcriptional regulator [Thalassomonas viridans]|uniref:Helix-turn-helix transcriptional regulator n=1 Tax=Thalassomonas viridans TaxID=137584 RepID=A0AAF0CAS3_9GAMM|nr:helix-turn-helix domain-containing protein [Thalassomonas viridans]WDE06645.1 helix-turn-helix transcriptional regulator [Thalassomonas viridans]
MARRSDCPISNVLDFVGDKWSLLILRDLMFFGKHSFSELQNSDEKMATNILSKRLETLEQDDLVSKQTDPSDKRKKVYTLTPKGKDMLPIMLEMMIWSSKHDPNTNAPKLFIERAINDRENLISDLLNKHEN